jgi:hypothetical protein
MKDIKSESIFSHDYEDILHICGNIHFDRKFCKRKITVEN